MSTHQRKYRFGPLERRLFLTTVVGLLPLAALAFVTLFESAQRQKQELFDSYTATMRAIVSAVDSELAESLSALDTLAASPRLAADDFDGLHAEGHDLLARRTHWLNVVLSDTHAQQLMNAALPLGQALPRGVDAQGIEDTARSGAPGVGNVVFFPGLHTYALSVRVPVKRAGVVKYVLTAVIEPNAIQDVLASQQLTDNTVSSVVDRAATIVARTRSQGEYFGRPASQGLVDLLALGRESGWAITNTLEGEPVYTVYYRSPRTAYAAAVGIPIAVLDGPLRRSYLLLGALVLASVLLGLIASQLVTRAITRPMRELKIAADAVGEGRAPQLPATRLPEITGVAAALLQAHGQIESSLESERAARAREHEARVLAEQASRMKDEFIAMLGHELRNPLAAVSSAATVLEHSLRGSTVNPMVANATAIIRRQTHHLARLTDDLLDAGRVVIGRIRLDRKTVDLGAIVQQALESLHNAHRLDGHTLDVALTSLWVDADPIRMNQVVMNLLTNAVKYTPAPGTIEVRLEREGDAAALTVRDTGIGIEPDLLPRIFDLFVQGKRSLDRSQGGLGIGLTLVRRLVELHGGQVSAASGGLGCGAQFTVRLPALRTLGSETRVEVAPAVPACRIVIVEDNDDVRTSLMHLLTMDGHDVRAAADGSVGLELILATWPDVALVDIGLPGLDGLALARALRRTPRGANIKLVAMTGYGSTENVRSGLQAGYDDYLVKPVDPAVLREMLASAPSTGRA